MRLSEAIRKGAAMVPQSFQRMFDTNDHGAIVGACAVGAASLACGHTDITKDEWVTWAMAMAQGGEFVTPCPVCLEHTCTHLWQLAVHLNDYHRWTREATADYLQTQEAIHGIGQDENAIQCEARELIEA